MPSQVIADAASVYNAIKASIVASGFSYDEVSAALIRINFAGDAAFVGVDNSILIEIGLNASKYRWRACLQPSTTATYTAAKSLTKAASGNNQVTEWRDVGAVGDTIMYSEVPGFVGFCPSKTQSYETEGMYIWKSTSPYDSGVRFFVARTDATDVSYKQYNWKVTVVSPSKVECWMTASAYRTINGDGTTQGCPIYQTVNGMVIDYTENFLAWRTDLTLIGQTFTVGGKAHMFTGYHYSGSDTRNETVGTTAEQPVDPTGGWQHAFRLVA